MVSANDYCLVWAGSLMNYKLRFVLPASLVICNDIFAYVCGFFWGRTQLIQLSPKKTVEGFLGAWLCTLVFSILVSTDQFIATWVCSNTRKVVHITYAIWLHDLPCKGTAIIESYIVNTGYILKWYPVELGNHRLEPGKLQSWQPGLPPCSICSSWGTILPGKSPVFVWIGSDADEAFTAHRIFKKYGLHPSIFMPQSWLALHP